MNGWLKFNAGWAAFSSLLAGCGTEKTTPDAATTEAHAARTDERDTAQAPARLRVLFERYRVTTVRGAARSRPVFPPIGARPLLEPNASAPKTPLLDASAPSESLEIALPRRANGGFRVRDPRSNVAVSIALVGARDVAVETTGDYALSRRATSEGGDVVQHVGASGIEDFVELRTSPPGGVVEYELELETGSAGLRLVGNVLEVVDAAGAPRLRTGSPFVVGSNGEVARAELDVAGCAVDREPSAPWGRAPVAPNASTCRVSVRFDASAVSYPALLDPAWNSAGSLATARTGAQAVLLNTGRVLVAGGRGFDASSLASAELYDPSTRTWATTGSLGTPRADHTLTLRPNGQALAVGGRDASFTVLSSSELYDATAGVWAAGPALAGPHAEQRATVLGTGDVLIAGGTNLAAEKLSNRSSTWSSAGNLLSAATNHTLTLLADGRALLVGGTQPELYDPATNHWLPTTGASGTTRQHHTTTRLASGQLLVIGNQTPTAELFDATSGVWSRPGAAVVRRSGHTATLLSDGRVLVVGGAPAATSAFLASEIFAPNFGTFAPGPAMLTLRQDHVAVLLPSGKVLLAGGADPTTETVLASAEEFDPSALATKTAEYKFPASVDAEVLSDRATELWASVTRPATLAPGKRYPLLVFLHGNHGTCGSGSNPRHDFDCTYTYTGTCPSGFVVTPNHRGYDYLASELAGRGFIVVSINANRGINCAGGGPDDFGLNLARGRLILRHLEALSSWNRGTANTPASLGVSLQGALDFSQIGLFGHSRGGEGVRAAYQQYRDAGSPWPARLVDPLSVRAMFEVGPVDGQTSRVLNASGTTWNVLLPMCDGDVSDLEGVRPFDRMLEDTTSGNVGAKSTYTVWGANHNFFNTEWQDSDSGGCTDHRALFSSSDMGSAEQRQTAMQAVVSFFAANVGVAPAPELEDLFNPEHRTAFDSPVERGYAPAPSASKLLEEFTNAGGTSSAGIRNTLSRVSVTNGQLPEHDSTLRGATVNWATPGTSTYFQINFANSGGGVDLSSYSLLDFRVDRPKDPANVVPSTSFEVALVNSDDTLSSLVSPAAYAEPVVGPVGGPYQNYHEMLETVRLPLASFTSANLAAVRGVRFVFRLSPSGSIHLANLRATHSTLVGTQAASASASPVAVPAAVGGSGVVTPGARAVTSAARTTSGNSVVSVRTTTDGQAVEITLATGTPFVPRAQLLELDVGAAKSVLSRHPSGSLREVAFVLDKTTFAALPDRQALSVRYAGGSGNQWDFGLLDKQRLDR